MNVAIKTACIQSLYVIHYFAHGHIHVMKSTYINYYHLSRRELQTTVTELKAIAALAIHGSRVIPTGDKTPAAIGMPIML